MADIIRVFRPFPAQAGMNREMSKNEMITIPVPRAGGDEPTYNAQNEVKGYRSPRRRG